MICHSRQSLLTPEGESEISFCFLFFPFSPLHFSLPPLFCFSLSLLPYLSSYPFLFFSLHLFLNSFSLPLPPSLCLLTLPPPSVSPSSPFSILPLHCFSLSPSSPVSLPLPLLSLPPSPFWLLSLFLSLSLPRFSLSPSSPASSPPFPFSIPPLLSSPSLLSHNYIFFI